MLDGEINVVNATIVQVSGLHTLFSSLKENGILQMDKIPLETCGEESAIRFRDCFSVRYIQSAALLCQLAFAIEQEYRVAKEIPGSSRDPSRSFYSQLGPVFSRISRIHH